MHYKLRNAVEHPEGGTTFALSMVISPLVLFGNLFGFTLRTIAITG